MATGTAALLMPRGAGDKSQLDAWECYAVQPDVVPFDVLLMSFRCLFDVLLMSF